MSQLHKRFTTEQVKELLERYINKQIERKHIENILENESPRGIKPKEKINPAHRSKLRCI